MLKLEYNGMESNIEKGFIRAYNYLIEDYKKAMSYNRQSKMDMLFKVSHSIGSMKWVFMHDKRLRKQFDLLDELYKIVSSEISKMLDQVG